MQRPWSGAEWQSASHISFVYSHMMGGLSPKARSPTQRLTKSSEGWAKAAVPRLSYYQIKDPQLVPQLKRLQHGKVVSSKIFHLPSFGRVCQGDPRLDNHVPGNDTGNCLSRATISVRMRYSVHSRDQKSLVSKVRGGGGLNPGSTQVRTLGLDQRGGRPNINIKNLGSTQVQPRFNPGSTQFQPRFNPSSYQV